MQNIALRSKPTEKNIKLVERGLILKPMRTSDQKKEKFKNSYTLTPNGKPKNQQ